MKDKPIQVSEDKSGLVLTMREGTSVFIVHKGELLELVLNDIRNKKNARIKFIGSENFVIKRDKVFDPTQFKNENSNAE